MKHKLILLLLILCGIYNIVSSQPTFGFQLGTNLSSLRGQDNYDENTIRFSATAYVFAEVPLTSDGFISLETGVSYSPQGMKHMYEYPDPDGIHNHTLHITNKIDYFVMPIYLKENFTNIYTKIGPYGAYLFNATSEIKDEKTKSFQIVETDNTTNEEFSENANMFDYGVSFGVGYIYYFDQLRRRRRRYGKRVVPIMQIDLKYNIGLRSIDSKGDTPNMDFKNRVFMIGITISSVYNR